MNITNTSANNLTTLTYSRRFSDGVPATTRLRRTLLAYCALLAGGAALAITVTAHATDWQSLSKISAVAEQYVLERMGRSDQRVKPQAARLDPRLRLPSCDSELEPFLRRGTALSARTVVGVRCNGSRPWKLYVPVEVVVTESVLIASKTLPRGHVLAATDLDKEDRDVSRLTRGYLSKPEDAIGQRLKRQVVSGKIITPSLLVADLVVKRGQSVTLVVRRNGLSIKMAGKALMDGAVNQRIRVENVASARIVEGLVRSPEYVEVLVQ